MKPKHSWYDIPRECGDVAAGEPGFPEGGYRYTFRCMKCGARKVYEERETNGKWIVWYKNEEDEGIEQKEYRAKVPWPCSSLTEDES